MTILAVNPTTGMYSTSGSFNFSVARDDIIRQGMMNLGLLEESEVPTAQEVTDVARVLNMIVKQLAGGMDKAPGFKMFQRQRAELFLGYSKYLYNLGATGDNWAASVGAIAYPQQYGACVTTAAVAAAGTTIPVGAANVALFTIGDYVGIQTGNDLQWTTVSTVGASSITIPAPGLTLAAAAGSQVFNYTVKAQRPVEILTAVLRDVNGTDTDLRKMSLQEYEALPTKTQPGFVQDPTAFYYEAQMANNLGQLYIDCSGAQDVTKHLHVVYLRQSMDFDNPGDAPEFPQEWFLHLSWELSLQICGMFDGDWTKDRQGAYAQAVGRAREANPQVDTAYFQPDDEN